MIPSCWPSQKLGVHLFAVLLPELWKPRKWLMSVLCPLVPVGKSAKTFDMTSQGLHRKMAGVPGMGRVSCGVRGKSAHLYPGPHPWQAGDCGPAQPSPSRCCFCNLVGGKKISATQKHTSPGPLWPSPLPSWMSSVLYGAWSLVATANSTMFTSFLKGDSSLGGQGRAGLGGELGR